MSVFSLNNTNSLAFSASERRKKKIPPRLIKLRYVSQLAYHDGSRFLGGTACEGALFRQAQQLDATAKLLLERFPLSETATKTPMQFYGPGDREVPSMLLSLLRRALCGDVVYQQLKGRREQRQHEKGVIEALKNRFSIAGVEQNPWIMDRGKRGTLEVFRRDNTWLQIADAIPDLPVTMRKLLSRHARFWRSKKDNGNGLFHLAKHIRGMENIEMGRFESSTNNLPDNIGLVSARNILAHAFLNNRGEYPKYLVDTFMDAVIPKLHPKGLLLLGECEVASPNPFITKAIVEALVRNNMRPVLPPSCPLLVPNDVTGATTYAPCLFEKDA